MPPDLSDQLNDFFWFEYYLEQGQISQRDVFAPYDFSFINSDGLEIKVKKNELIVEKGEKFIAELG